MAEDVPIRPRPLLIDLSAYRRRCRRSCVAPSLGPGVILEVFAGFEPLRAFEPHVGLRLHWGHHRNEGGNNQAPIPRLPHGSPFHVQISFSVFLRAASMIAAARSSG